MDIRTEMWYAEENTERGAQHEKNHASSHFPVFRIDDGVLL